MCDCLFANVCVCPVCARVRVYAFASACIHVYEFVCLCACCFATGAGVFTSTRLSKLAKGGEIISTTFYKGKNVLLVTIRGNSHAGEMVGMIEYHTNHFVSFHLVLSSNPHEGN